MKRPYQVTELHSASYLSTHSTLKAATIAARKAYRAASNRDTIVVLFYPEGGYQRKTEVALTIETRSQS
jgi:hypothetical protein